MGDQIKVLVLWLSLNCLTNKASGSAIHNAALHTSAPLAFRWVRLHFVEVVINSQLENFLRLMGLSQTIGRRLED